MHLTIKLALKFILIAAVLAAMIGTSSVLAAANDAVCTGANIAAGEDGNGCGGDSSGKVEGVVKDAINIFSWIIGVVAVIFIIIGGFQYITSSGDAARVTKARNTILYAVIGLIIVAFAQILVRFVVGSV